MGISFLLLIMLLAACDGLRSSTAEEDDSLTASEAMPHYEIEFTLSEDLIFLQGSAHIRVPNTSADPWTHLVSAFIRHWIITAAISAFRT